MSQRNRVAATGYHELVRNWRSGVGLAERVGREFALINVGPRRLAGSHAGLADKLKTSPGRAFAFVSWPDLVRAVGHQSRPRATA